MLTRVMSLVHLDFAPNHGQPPADGLRWRPWCRSSARCWPTRSSSSSPRPLIPGTKGYAHFQFADYAKLTVIGVIIACAAWPVTTRITSRPRWMFFRMAILVTLVLWLPDVYILVKGQPAKAVGFLFAMHLAIALVTYNALVRLAPVRARRGRPGTRAGAARWAVT